MIFQALGSHTCIVLQEERNGLDSIFSCSHFLLQGDTFLLAWGLPFAVQTWFYKGVEGGGVVLLCSPSWPQIPDPPASSLWVQGLQARSTIGRSRAVPGTIWRRSPWIKIDCSIWFVKKKWTEKSVCVPYLTRLPHYAIVPRTSSSEAPVSAEGRWTSFLAFNAALLSWHAENRTTRASENKWNFCSKVKDDTAGFHLCKVSGKANLQQQKIDQCLPGAGVGLGTNQKWVWRNILR